MTAAARMGPRLRKLALTLHIVASVGWLGAVAVFLALAVAGLTSGETQTVRAAYLAMGVTAWWVIVPLAFASLATGLVQSLCTEWGLFRHYWILAKLLLTVVSTLVLLLHMGPIDQLAAVAAERGLADWELRPLRVELVRNSVAALAALLAATALSVYKPRGLTPHGRRKRHEARAP